MVSTSFCRTVSQNIEGTVKSLLQAKVSIRIITVHGDGGEPLLEATSSSNLSVRVAILRC